MNYNWKYHENSKPALNDLMKIIEQEKDENISDTTLAWRKLFPHASINSSLNEHNVIDIINLSSPNDTTSETINGLHEQTDSYQAEKLENNNMEAEQCETSGDNNFNSHDIATQLLDDLRDDNVDKEYFISVANSNKFPDICANLLSISTESIAFKFTKFFIDISENLNMSVVKLFFACFLFPLLTKGLSHRAIENCLILCISKYPSEICENVILPLLKSSQPVNSLVTSPIIQTLDITHKYMLLNNLIKNPMFEIAEWSISIILLLLNSVPVNDVAKFKGIVKLLATNSMKYCRNVSFGKLLYAAIQKFKNYDEVKTALWQIVNENKSAFKTSCMNLLNNASNKFTLLKSKM